MSEVTSLLDSALYSELFTDASIKRLLSDEARIRAMLSVEAALARVEGKRGIIPPDAAVQISDAADELDVSLDDLVEGVMNTGMPVSALVNALQESLADDAAEFVHWGATTQDIMDTALALQLREVLAAFAARLSELSAHLAVRADQHRADVMAGRTHGQQAVPVTFGLKCATWLTPILRHEARLQELAPRLLVLQFGGSAGTLAALGDKGLEVTAALADELGLAAPVIPWHSQRDAIVEFAGWLSLVNGSLAKMAQDVILLAQSEIAEVRESSAARGGIAAMPQNPVMSEVIIAAARTNASLLSAMHHALVHEQERSTHGWQLEWLCLPQMTELTAGALKNAVSLVQDLEVDVDRMRANIAHANDLIMAEATVLTLANHMPRSEARALVERACEEATNENRPLVNVVRSLMPSNVKGKVDWKALAEPGNYLGENNRMINAVLAQRGGNS